MTFKQLLSFLVQLSKFDAVWQSVGLEGVQKPRQLCTGPDSPAAALPLVCVCPADALTKVALEKVLLYCLSNWTPGAQCFPRAGVLPRGHQVAALTQAGIWRTVPFSTIFLRVVD